MNLYGQEPEARLLASFVPKLEQNSMIDVGAERGSFTEEVLEAGIEVVYAIEPEPGNAAFLRRHFAREPRVSVLEYAAGDSDGRSELHMSTDPAGDPVTYGHTLLTQPDSDELVWRASVAVETRSLASLMENGRIPRHVGILKIDTEGNDLGVVQGMGGLECDVVMVEQWADLPHSFGPCPWSAEEVAAALRPRGLSQFASIVHGGELVTLRWNEGAVPPGKWANLVFLHDRVLTSLLPDLLECASRLGDRAVEVGEMYVTAANERLALIDRLEGELQGVVTAANERLALIDRLEGELQEVLTAANERLALVHRLEGELQETLGRDQVEP